MIDPVPGAETPPDKRPMLATAGGVFGVASIDAGGAVCRADTRGAGAAGAGDDGAAAAAAGGATSVDVRAGAAVVADTCAFAAVAGAGFPGAED